MPATTPASVPVAKIAKASRKILLSRRARCEVAGPECVTAAGRVVIRYRLFYSRCERRRRIDHPESVRRIDVAAMVVRDRQRRNALAQRILTNLRDAVD